MTTKRKPKTKCVDKKRSDAAKKYWRRKRKEEREKLAARASKPKRKKSKAKRYAVCRDEKTGRIVTKAGRKKCPPGQRRTLVSRGRSTAGGAPRTSKPRTTQQTRPTYGVCRDKRGRITGKPVNGACPPEQKLTMTMLRAGFKRRAAQTVGSASTVLPSGNVRTLSEMAAVLQGHMGGGTHTFSAKIAEEPGAWSFFGLPGASKVAGPGVAKASAELADIAKTAAAG